MNGVQLGFPDSVSRVLKAQPRGYAKPQYVEYNPHTGNNILYGNSEFSDFHNTARSDMLLQLENKKRDAEARERRFLMGNPMPKLPMHSWTSAGSPFMMADKTVPMGNSDLRGGTQPNYTPEALAIQRKMLKRRANEAGVLSRNELPPPTMKPKKTFAESLKDVIDTVLIGMGDAITSGNYGRVAFEGVYKLIRSFSENGYIFESRDIGDFIENIEDMIEQLRGVITQKINNPNSDVNNAKILYTGLTRVMVILKKLDKETDRSLSERKIASRPLIQQLKKDKAPAILEGLYDEMMSQVMSEIEGDRGTVVPRSFGELGELPMDVYREEGEDTFDPYAMEGFSESMSRPSLPRGVESEEASRDMSYQAFMDRRSAIAEEAEADAEAEAQLAPNASVPPPSIQSTTGLTLVAPNGDTIEGIEYNGMLIPAGSNLFNRFYSDSLATLRAFADAIGYRYSQYTDRPNLKRGIISKIRRTIPNW
jgi:hypothetical protein